MKKLIVVALVAFCIAEAGEGSVYSRYGIGEVLSNARGKNVGMGSVGVGILGETFINFANPAAIANIPRTMLSAGYQFRNYNSEDATGSSAINTGNINEFGLALPLYSPKKIVLALGVLPFSTVGYDQHIEMTVPGATVAVNQQFEGHGGLSSAQISLSYLPATDFYLGATGHYLFGAIYRDQFFHFNSPSFYNGSYNQTLSLSGFAVTVGSIYKGVDRLLGFSQEKNLNIGAALFSGSSLDLDNETLRNFSSNQDTIQVNNKSMNLPWGFSLGISYLNHSILYAADITLQNWSDFKFAGVRPSEVQNSIQLGAGVEFLQSNNIADPFWEKISYRFGGNYRKTNVVLNGQSINELFVAGGIGFPFSLDSRMNLGLEYGIRGTTSSSLIKDTIIRFTISLTVSELMFIPPPID